MRPNTDSTPKVEPFYGTKYTLWAFKIKMYIMSKGLWEAVNRRFSFKTEKEQQSHGTIVLNLSHTHLMHFVTHRIRAKHGALTSECTALEIMAS